MKYHEIFLSRNEDMFVAKRSRINKCAHIRTVPSLNEIYPINPNMKESKTPEKVVHFATCEKV